MRILFNLMLVPRPIASEMESDLATTRDRTRQMIMARPGVSLRELARDLGVTWGTIKYHVTRLEAEGLVGTRVIGRHRVCYHMDVFDEYLADARAMLKEPTARRLAMYIVSHPDTNMQDVIANAQASPRMVYYHLKRFIDEGLISARQYGYRSIGPTAKLYAALE